MQNFLQLLLRFGTFWSFLILEIICFYLVVNYNQKQQKIFISSSNRFIGGVYDRYDGVMDYIRLNDQIQELEQENARLRQQIDGYTTLFSRERLGTDSLDLPAHFNFIPARIISKSIINFNNTITINRGEKDGVRPHMGVIDANGIVGIVRRTTENYAVVMSNFHTQTRIPATIRKRNAHGTLTWESTDTRKMDLKHIPRYIAVTKGDSVFTSGYSFIFPENYPIGMVDEVETTANNHHQISVLLHNKLEDLDLVYVVVNLNEEEIEKLEGEKDGQ